MECRPWVVTWRRIPFESRPAESREFLPRVGMGAPSVVVTQCQKVDDQIAAPKTQSLVTGGTNSGTCIARCARAYSDSVRAESGRHVAAMQDCDGLESCLDYETIMHTRA